MDQVSATRTELLNRRAQIELAVQGKDLLTEKRDQLLDEFRRVANVVMGGTDALERSATEGRRLLAIAEASDGPEAVLSAAVATRSEIPLRASATSIMGVRVARIDHEPVGRPRTGRGYGLTGTGPRIDAVAEAYEAQLDLILEVASTEIRLRRIADEIGKTTRRVNALEFAVIPLLIAERKQIQSVLEERERQDHFRLKRVKQHKARAPRMVHS